MGESTYRHWAAQDDQRLHLLILGHPIVFLFIVVILFCAIFYIISLKSICCSDRDEKDIGSVQLHTVTSSVPSEHSATVDNAIGLETTVWLYAWNGMDMQSGFCH